jgi:hypothetical protein
MPRVLKDLEISEVSVVDRGAGEGTRIALFKRDTPRRKRFAGYSTTAAAARAALLRKYTNIFKGEDFLNIRPMFDEGETPPPDTPKFDADHADVATIETDIDDGEDEEAEQEAVQHTVDILADRLVESRHSPDRATALRHILFSAPGRQLLRETHKVRKQQQPTNKKETNTMPTTDTWHTVAKADGGIAIICKHVIDSVEKGAKPSLDEHALTALITTAAKAAYPTLKPAVAFAKLFEEDEQCRRAIAAVKNAFVAGFPLASIMPVSSNADEATGAGGNEADAYDQLQKLVDSERAKFPFLSNDRLFAKVVEQNPELFVKERLQSRARLAATLPAMPH